LRFVCIGMPGHGKSTVLNEIAKQGLFAVGAAGSSCTQAGGEWEAKNTKVITIDDGKTETKLELIDTPGFPDPDEKVAAEYYDHVVKACNQKINGVLFVLKPEREMADVLEKYATLLKEFIHLEVPLIILVNGTEAGKSKWDTDEQYAATMAQTTRDFRKIARNIERRCGLHAREILVSATKDQIASLGADVARAFAASPARKSSVKTYAAVLEELKKCENTEYQANAQVDYEDARIKKCNSDVSALENHISNLKAWAAGTCWIPFGGQVAAAILLSKCAAKQERIKELYSAIGDAENEKRAAGNLEEMKKKSEIAKKDVMNLGKYLGKIALGVK